MLFRIRDFLKKRYWEGCVFLGVVNVITFKRVKWNRTTLSKEHLDDILEVKNAFVKCLCYVTKYSILNLVRFLLR